MNELTVTVVRLGLLVVLWVFVFSVVGVLRGDLFGTRVTQKAGPCTPPEPQPAVARESKAPKRDKRTPSSVLVTEGPLRGTTIALGSQSVLIGRSPESTLVLDDDYASGRHARIYPQGDEWFVEDLGSTNGTFSGQQRITGEPVRLEVGSTLRIGTTVLELRR
ncbi:FHA domain-containing protein FhaB/FipA [Angustibacter aerolatus]